MASHLSRLFSGLRVSPLLPSLGGNLVSRCSGQATMSAGPNHIQCLKSQSSFSFITTQLARQIQSMSIHEARSSRPLLHPPSSAVNIHRNKTICGLRKGKGKTVRPVVKRFYRLDWGIWIRPKTGRYGRLWKKNKNRKFRLKQHVFCNKQQSKLLDKMVTSFWKRKKYYVEDPYEPYQRRTNFPLLPDKPKPFYP